MDRTWKGEGYLTGVPGVLPMGVAPGYPATPGEVPMGVGVGPEVDPFRLPFFFPLPLAVVVLVAVMGPATFMGA